MRPYVIAGILGLLLGMGAMVLATVFPYVEFEPAWRVPFPVPGQNDLRNQAFFYRFCHILIDSGFSFMVISVGFALVTVKLSELSLKSRIAQVLMALLISSILSVGLLVGSMIFGTALYPRILDPVIFFFAGCLSTGFYGLVGFMQSGSALVIMLIVLLFWLRSSYSMKFWRQVSTTSKGPDSL